jgi:hypothetical protein
MSDTAAPMREAEILFPVVCPVCAQGALTRFRMGVVTEALQTGEIRLYSNCHLAAWDANTLELDEIRDYLDGAMSAALAEACEELEEAVGG